MNATTEPAGTPELLMPQALLARTAERLAVQYRGIVSEQTVERVVFESYTALRRTARIQRRRPSPRRSTTPAWATAATRFRLKLRKSGTGARF